MQDPPDQRTLQSHRNVFVSRSGVALKWPMSLVTESVWPNHPTGHFYRYAVAKRFLSKTKKYGGDKTYAFIHNHWSRGYHHWVVESLVRLMHLNNELSDPVNILIPEDYPVFAHQSLELLCGEHAVERIPSGKNARIPNAIVAANPAYKVFIPDTIARLREWVWLAALPENREKHPHRRIYISREFAQMRRVENERQVQAAMRAAGFEIIHTEKLSFCDQVVLFSETKILAGIHGAGLTNLVFMRPGTQLLEFRRSPIAGKKTWNHCFRDLAAAAGVRHSLLDCEAGTNDAKCLARANLIVHTGQLAASLRRLESDT
ncbi:glycosyltransferase family 61 protein [Rhodopirellula halodulae]|uniref:glycosyltransferase family 61 protein n=1 Tax=Rhodopirellula halodulae TaxID=2894198 RepID=UPI001E6045E8|nr:glycosyltransferase family 61 protein [Rhodopirellula sp. JC737]MCC9656526.1 glycosyltransferase family 61 protein [Rhodopirellula sp. JC737]